MNAITAATDIRPVTRQRTLRLANRFLRRAAVYAVLIGFAGFFLLRSEEHTSALQSPCNLVCRLLLEKNKYKLVKLVLNTKH